MNNFPCFYYIIDNFIMDILGLGSKVDVEFILDPQGHRRQTEVKIDDNKRSLQYIYYDGEDVSGTVNIKCVK